ncbi:MAG TPA: division/cell wall cluster transcriptional repressor MraZ [Flavobacteriales bacterium]|nr:division/cell wall cluster transcriptional repressor MraZ [Flavobacteriales bacterium]|tara:strand:- start:64843 stop:65310 length:468 start_codon:yes stop_codon:yes gene_type:complete
MTNFIGEFNCKLDAKGRVMLPAALRKQLNPEANERFVMNRGFEQCLVLYPKNEWEVISAEVNKLNQYIKKNREFIRYFYRGATELELDSNGRLLLPKRMLSYAGISKEVVLFAYGNRIEVWDKDKYDNLLTDEPEDFADLAEEVMGKNKIEGEDE